MKKCFVKALIICMLMICFSFGAFAAECDYSIVDLSVTTNSVSVTVKKLSEGEQTAAVYVALYDDYDMFLGAVRMPVTLSEGGITTVTKTLYCNSATTLKAFVWGGICTPRSEMIYKTTKIGNEIEYGGEV